MPSKYFFPFSVTVPMDVVSFEVEPSMVLLGAPYQGFVLRWQLSKDPFTLAIDGVNLPPNTPQFPIVGSLSANQTWKLVASDKDGNVARAKASLQFVNAIYYGLRDSAPTDSTDIDSTMTKRLGDDFTLDVTVTQTDDSQLFYLLYPSRLGTPRRLTVYTPSDPWGAIVENATDFRNEVTVGSMQFSNENAYVETYTIIAFAMTLQPGANRIVIE